VIPDVKPLAAGGIVTGPTLGLIGEAGEPEAVVPLSRAGEFGFGGAGVNVDLRGAHVYGIDHLDRLVVDAVARATRRGMIPRAS
jgi:hypothetical protein